MFDAKSILEGLVRGAGGGAGRAGQSGGGLADILAEVLKDRSQPGGQSPGGQPRRPSGDYGELGDILGQLARGARPASSAKPGDGSAGEGGGLADIIADIQRKLEQASAKLPRSAASEGPKAGTSPQGAEKSDGNLLDTLSEVLRQATAGAREGATRIGESTGAKDAIGRATGRSPEEILARLKEFIQQNPLAAGAAAGGLGGLVLGTRAGRAIAGGAARIGALALIGGLAYKAFQNYQAGKPLVGDSEPAEAAPKGSGFEPAAVSNEAAALYIRAMIAAAAADGRLDEGEQSRIVDSLKQGGVDADAEEFLANELNRPATIQELAAAVTSPQEALQVYTSARIAIEPDDAAESKFLKELAQALKIDGKLAAHVEANIKGAAA